MKKTRQQLLIEYLGDYIKSLEYQYKNNNSNFSFSNESILKNYKDIHKELIDIENKELK